MEVLIIIMFLMVTLLGIREILELVVAREVEARGEREVVLEVEARVGHPGPVIVGALEIRAPQVERPLRDKAGPAGLQGPAGLLGQVALQGQVGLRETRDRPGRGALQVRGPLQG